MSGSHKPMRGLLIWGAVLALMAVPVAYAAASPLLSYRGGAYIVGGFAGIFCLALMVLQPLLAAGYLPGAGGPRGRLWHRWLGGMLTAGVVLHVAGLYVTSPPDTLDALLLVSPTPFSVYGVAAMWAVLLTALLAGLRRRIGLRPRLWQQVHAVLALVIAVSTVVHAVQIQGAMEPVTKWGLCLTVLAATGAALLDLRVLKPLRRWRDRRDTRPGRA
ncbi:ferric reductase-like transmembrane domain-containing protein [Mameliella alba]|uniref:ferric reductase-like transmembrane domain-containing protein n=2 Tax=Mameliella alba TaxID=561184 RepID=UPI001998CD2C|nr:ferric reductase-like transmembrane domain-containing protein [Mameliella alba]GGF60889.1 ferric reductase [Mameliella alba]